MGCGCKGTQQPPPAPSTQTSQSGSTQKQVTNESIKQSIKKTIEKYYYVNKSSQ
jgi:DNA-binding protein Fis